MSTLVFTVAHNGYAGAFAACLRSHREYCRRHGYTYVAVTRPLRVAEPALSAWLKVPLMAGALRAGYEWVAFIDADALVRPTTPDLRSVRQASGSVHMALGRSGRYNSGVMIAENGEPARGFFDAVRNSVTEDIPEEDRLNLKFENGNIIHVARRSDAVLTLPTQWNNTFDPDLDDHIRHYTGPLRAQYHRPRLSEWVFRQRKELVQAPTKQPSQRDEAFDQRLTALTRRCQRTYPRLISTPS